MMSLDLAIFKAIHGLWGRYKLVDAVGLFLAGRFTYLIAAALLVFIFKFGDFGFYWTLLLSHILLAVFFARGVFVTAISAVVRRRRPFEALGFEPPFVPVTKWSFPSGHAAALFAASFALFLWFPVWGAAFLTASFLVGLSRVFVGVHWPSDILFGAGIGIVWAFLAPWFFIVLF